MTGEFGRTGKDMVVAYLVVLTRDSPSGAEEIRNSSPYMVPSIESAATKI